MPKPKVFVTRRIPDAGLARIRDGCDADIWTEPLPPPHDVLVDRVRDCEGIVSLLTDRIDAELMDAAPRLRVISNYAVGYNNIDVPAATARGIGVGNTPGVLTDATADMAFCLLIGAARRLVEGDRFSRSGAWRTWEPLGHIGRDLTDKTIGIVGMGRIGFALARRCHLGWGMRVIYHDLQDVEPANRELKATRVDFDTLLCESDFISVHTDLNDATRGLFDRDAFRRMKKTAVFVNTARGPIVVQQDLVAALREGDIFAAGLDVTDPEPPDVDDPLLQLDNVIVAPHIASATVETRNAMAEIAADNLLLGLEKGTMRCPVNPDVVIGRR